MKKYLFTNYAATWWAEYQVDGMQTTDNQRVLGIRSMSVGGTVNPTDLDATMVALGLPNHYGGYWTEVQMIALATSLNLGLKMIYENLAAVTKYTALAVAAAPTNVVLAVGSATPVGGVTNVAIPAAGALDYTGAVTGWVTGTAGKIKITVTNAASTASTITINGGAYTSGADYDILAAKPLTVVLTTTRAGYFTQVRTFIISVSA